MNPTPPDLERETYNEIVERIGFQFDFTRREFVQTLGAGLIVTVLLQPVVAQRRGRGSRGGGASPARPVSARVHIGADGRITVLTGKVEGGQGARAELTQAAAEELRVRPELLQLLMADTDLVPDDGFTAGSRSTPSSVPSIRQGCAAAREVLIKIAADGWKVAVDQVEARDGRVRHAASNQSLAYGEIAAREAAVKAFHQVAPANVVLTPVDKWAVMGHATHRPNARDIVTGSHVYPSDVVRPGMLYGRILRAPAFGATLTSLDVASAQKLPGVITVRDANFAGVVAPTRRQAEAAIQVLARSAKWDLPSSSGGSSEELYASLKKNAEGGAPVNPFDQEMKQAAHTVRQEYHAAYIQHAPLEPRAAVAEWDKDKLTVWTGTQNPFGVRSELARTFRIAESSVRVITPDFGGGFGGKHTGECAVEAARLAKEAKKPVRLCWTRAEEFTWAYFRPAAVILAEAALETDGSINAWHFVNINSGPSAIDTPYRVKDNKSRCRFVSSQPPLRHGSYRALAATANNFARECFVDELAAAVSQDPLQFRLSHLIEPRLMAVLEKAAAEFGWADRAKSKKPDSGVGLACGTEKGSFVATCVEIALDSEGEISVRRICQAFECGAIVNPPNLEFQNRGALVMGLGPALREAITFGAGVITNATFRSYRVPRFADVPPIDIHLLNRPDLPSVGAGETPLIALAPAIANAVYHMTGSRVRGLPIATPAARV